MPGSSSSSERVGTDETQSRPRQWQHLRRHSMSLRGRGSRLCHCSDDLWVGGCTLNDVRAAKEGNLHKLSPFRCRRNTSVRVVAFVSAVSSACQSYFVCCSRWSCRLLICITLVFCSWFFGVFMDVLKMRHANVHMWTYANMFKRMHVKIMYSWWIVLCFIKGFYFSVWGKHFSVR